MPLEITDAALCDAFDAYSAARKQGKSELEAWRAALTAARALLGDDGMEAMDAANTARKAFEV